jgi:ribonuclease HI
MFDITLITAARYDCWCYALRCGDRRKEVSGCEPGNTGCRVELRALIEALKAIRHPSCIRLALGSKQIIKGIAELLPRWKSNGWRGSKKNRPLSNLDLWQEIDMLLSNHVITAVNARKDPTLRPDSDHCAAMARNNHARLDHLSAAE